MKRPPAVLVLSLLMAGLPHRPVPAITRLEADVRIHRSLAEAVPSRQAPVLLVFFSTGCASCYDELFQARLAVEKAGWPLTVIGVCQGPADELRLLLEKYAWTLPVVLDRRRLLFRRFGVEALPYKAVLVGGRTVYKDNPYSGYSRRWEELAACLKKLFSG